MAIYPATTVARFWSKVAVTKESLCWEWQGTKHGKGYGHIRIGEMIAKAHRVAWEIFNNQRLAPEQMVCHLCDNPACCNPGHLWLGTNEDNMRDRQAKSRQAVGRRNGKAKLTAEIVQDLRRTTDTAAAAARRHGISPNTVKSVRQGRTWVSIA